MALSIAFSPETIEEGLNEVFYQAYEAQAAPGLATIEDVFRVAPSNKHSEYDLRIAGVGEFPVKGEVGNIAEDYEEEKYKTTYNYVEFANSVPVSYAYLNDQLYSIVKDKVGRLGIAARHTMYKNAFKILQRANNTSYLGADGVQLVDGAHPAEDGQTHSNVLTGNFSYANLKTAIQMLMEQQDDRGILIPQVPELLVVATAKFGEATETVGTELTPNDANNSFNYVSKIFPGLRVVHSPYIGASMGGNDNNWFVLGSGRKLKKFVRFPLQTWMNDFQQSRSMTSYFNAHYGESAGWSDYIGVVGGNATWS